MKGADTAAASFIFPHPNKIIMGVSRIPPPIPIIPEKRPNTAPINKVNGRENLITSFRTLGFSIIRAVASSRKMPSMIL